MITIYPACFLKEEDGYSVIFPDLNWLATCGDDLNDSMAMAIDCLAGRLYLMEMDGDEIPPPTDLPDVDLDAVIKELESTTEEAFVSLVSVDVAAYAQEHFEKPVKKTLSIPDWLNKAALEKNINFSKVLQEALIQKLGLKRE